MKKQTLFVQGLFNPYFPWIFSIILMQGCVLWPLSATSANDDSLKRALLKLNPKARIEVLIRLSQQNLFDDPEKSLQFARQAAGLAEQVSDRKLRADLFKTLGDACYENDSLMGSLQAYLKSIENEELVDPPRRDSLGRRYSDAGFMLSELGYIDLCLEYHYKALNINEELKDSVELAVNYNNIGANLKIAGKFGEAIDALNKALQIDKMISTESELAIDYNNIGVVYQSWGRYKESIDFFNIALEMDLKMGNKARLSTRYSNLALSFLKLKKTDEAVQYYEKALALDRELGNKEKIPVRMQGLGLAYLEKGKFEKAEELFEKSLADYQILGQQPRIVMLYNDLGKLYQKWNNTGKAIEHFRKGLDLAESTGMKPDMIHASTGLYQLYKEQGDFRQALHYYEIFTAMQDSLFSKQNLRQINEFNIRFETEKRENENKLLVKNLEISRRIQWFALTVIAGLTILALALFYAFRIKRKLLNQSRALMERERELNKLRLVQADLQNRHLQEVLFSEEEIRKLQQQSLEQKNHELTSASLLIANKNEVFENLRKLAEQIREKESVDKNEIVRSMIREIDRQTNVESQWEQFRTHFESIHKSFFSKLKEIQPDLTQPDLQLCAYIKLNMITKEISRLMNITPESVNTHRYRLRKKLNLPAGEMLDEFIHKI